MFGRVAGYEDVNDAERLARDPAMRAIVGREGLDRAAASSSQMSRFETEWLATDANLEALTDLSGAWIDRVHDASRPTASSSTWTVPRARPTASRRLSLERSLRLHVPGHVYSAQEWRLVLELVIARYRERGVDLYFRADAAFAKPELYDIRYAIRLPAN